MRGLYANKHTVVTVKDVFMRGLDANKHHEVSVKDVFMRGLDANKHHEVSVKDVFMRGLDANTYTNRKFTVNDVFTGGGCKYTHAHISPLNYLFLF